MKKAGISLGLMILCLLFVHPVFSQDVQPPMGMDDTEMNSEAMINNTEEEQPAEMGVPPGADDMENMQPAETNSEMQPPSNTENSGSY